MLNSIYLCQLALSIKSLLTTFTLPAIDKFVQAYNSLTALFKPSFTSSLENMIYPIQDPFSCQQLQHMFCSSILGLISRSKYLKSKIYQNGGGLVGIWPKIYPKNHISTNNLQLDLQLMAISSSLLVCCAISPDEFLFLVIFSSDKEDVDAINILHKSFCLYTFRIPQYWFLFHSILCFFWLTICRFTVILNGNTNYCR